MEDNFVALLIGIHDLLREIKYNILCKQIQVHFIHVSVCLILQYVESMSELIRKGIEEANKDLEIENQHKLQQEVRELWVICTSSIRFFKLKQVFKAYWCL